MDAKDFAKKEPMAMPGFTVLTPKQETASTALAVKFFQKPGSLAKMGKLARC